MIQNSHARVATTAASLMCAAVLALGASSVGAEIQIAYLTDDLPDAIPGQDLWRYTYTVSGQAFTQSYGFNIYYPWQTFDMVALVASPQTAWSPVDVLGPQRTLDQPGLLSASAADNLPAQPWIFVVDVVWLSMDAGVPGSQAYDLFDTDFNRLEPPGVLQTVAPTIPEPQTSMLMLAGFALLAVLSMRRDWSRSLGRRA